MSKDHSLDVLCLLSIKADEYYRQMSELETLPHPNDARYILLIGHWNGKTSPYYRYAEFDLARHALRRRALKESGLILTKCTRPSCLCGDEFFSE